MLEFLFEIIFQLLGEILGQLILELGFHSLIEPFRSGRKSNPILSFIGYCLLGGVAGVVSLLIIPAHMIDNPTVQLANLFVTPVILGLFFTWFGRKREKKELEPLPLDSFSYGFTFALGMALVRYYFAA